jgi:hypothetical protein
MGGNIFINNDPTLRGIDYNSQLSELERMQVELEQRKQTLQNLGSKVQQPISSTPIWDEIDSIVSGMTEQERSFMEQDKEYQDNYLQVMNVLQAQYLRIMRPYVEGTSEGKEALQEQLMLVKRLKKQANKVVNAEFDEFKEYKEKYSHMSYQDYLKTKKEVKQ